MCKVIKCNDGRELIRLSEWLPVEVMEVCQNDDLWYYADEDTDNGEGVRLVDAFTFEGKPYAVGQFHYINYGGFHCVNDLAYNYVEDGTAGRVDCYDVDSDLYDSMVAEFKEFAEYVRLYKEG